MAAASNPWQIYHPPAPIIVLGIKITYGLPLLQIRHQGRKWPFSCTLIASQQSLSLWETSHSLVSTQPSSTKACQARPRLSPNYSVCPFIKTYTAKPYVSIIGRIIHTIEAGWAGILTHFFKERTSSRPSLSFISMRPLILIFSISFLGTSHSSANQSIPCSENDSEQNSPITRLILSLYQLATSSLMLECCCCLTPST